MEILKEKGFKAYEEIYSNKSSKEALLINNHEGPDEVGIRSYDYLLGLSMFTFTEERLDELRDKMK